MEEDEILSSTKKRMRNHRKKVKLSGLGFFLIRFDFSSGFEDVLKRGPWFIGAAGPSDVKRYDWKQNHANSAKDVLQALVQDLLKTRDVAKSHPNFRISKLEDSTGRTVIRIDEDVIELIRKDPLHVWGWYDAEIAQAWTEIAPAGGQLAAINLESRAALLANKSVNQGGQLAAINLESRAALLVTKQKQLSLLVGDYLVVQKVSPSGWPEGEYSGKAGWFPSAYVEKHQRIPTSNVAM
uniref:SH3 domain-containing protein n=1 Tax=Fagus sylvatica TaxID=28930 RepID=A0A2N9HHH3_FAGSY